MYRILTGGAAFIIICFLFAGCGAPVSRRSHLPDGEPLQQVPDLPDTANPLLVVYDDTVVFTGSAEQESEPFDVEEMLGRARALCRKEHHDSCAQVLHDIIDNISSDATVNEGTSDQKDEVDRHYHEVVDIYLSCLPSAWYDSIPDEISMLVFQRRLSQSLDSLSISSDDSIAMVKLFCRQGIEYNVPIVWNDRVHKALYFYTSGKKGPVSRWLGKATHYFPFMSSLFSDSGLPSDLAYLPLIESGFNPKAYSYAHASGIWQFIPSTGRRYGLRLNYWIDERRDPVKSTQAAICYLKKLYNDFNDWHCALAAYNCGEHAVGRARNRANSIDYWELSLPRQTMNYVPQYIAALIVAKNPACFGFDIDSMVSFSLDTVSVSDCIDLKTIAASLNIPLDSLRGINPHLRRWCTAPNIEGQHLYLPAGKRTAFVSFLDTLSDENKVTWYRYRIKPGDNLIAIARRFRLSVSAIRSVNNLRSSRIIAGKHLFIPIPVNSTAVKSVHSTPRKKRKMVTERTPPAGWKPMTYPVKKGDNLYDIAVSLGVSLDELAGWNRLSKQRPLIHPGDALLYYVDPAGTKSEAYHKQNRNNTFAYKVKRSDNISTLASLFSVSPDALCAVNDMKKDDLLLPGRILEIPKTGTTTPDTRKPIPRIVYYRVKTGDNLWNISRVFKVGVDRISRLNRLNDSSRLVPGDTLKIPLSENL